MPHTLLTTAVELAKIVEGAQDNGLEGDDLKKSISVFLDRAVPAFEYHLQQATVRMDTEQAISREVATATATEEEETAFQMSQAKRT